MERFLSEEGRSVRVWARRWDIAAAVDHFTDITVCVKEEEEAFLCSLACGGGGCPPPRGCSSPRTGFF